MVELPPFVQALLNPEAYPQKPQRVELAQTHISFVFLTGPYVYKVKKPVDLGFLNFSTLELRRFYCEQEVLLNRRLAPDVYLGVEEIREQAPGRFGIGGPGVTVDYAVKMRQLPRDRMMNHLLDEGRVSQEDVRSLAVLLARFHAEAEASDVIARFGSPESVGRNSRENFEQTEKYLGRTVSPQRWEETSAYTQAFLEEQRPLLERRQEDGKIRDCHGDLHSGQIFLAEKVYVLDCIEFNERFRYIDIVNDLAFLAMDLEFHGRRDLAKALVETYTTSSGDQEAQGLLDFYKCYRACVRAKVSSFQLDDPSIPGPDKTHAARLASEYFDLAHSYAVKGKGPFLLICSGMVGTGKSTVAQELAQRSGFALLSSDLVRKALAGIPASEHRWERFESGMYSADFTRRTYDELFRRAKELLREGRSVILDASFRKAQEREKARALADESGAQIYVLECVCSEEEVKARLEIRLLQGGSPSDGRWEIYLEQKGIVEPVAEVPRFRHLVLDTTASSQQAVALLLEQLGDLLGGRRA